MKKPNLDQVKIILFSLVASVTKKLFRVAFSTRKGYKKHVNVLLAVVYFFMQNSCFLLYLRT